MNTICKDWLYDQDRKVCVHTSGFEVKEDDAQEKWLDLPRPCFNFQIIDILNSFLPVSPTGE